MFFLFLLVPVRFPFTRRKLSNLAKLQFLNNKIYSYTKKKQLALGNFIIQELMFCIIAKLFCVFVSLLRENCVGIKEDKKDTFWSLGGPFLHFYK